MPDRPQDHERGRETGASDVPGNAWYNRGPDPGRLPPGDEPVGAEVVGSNAASYLRVFIRQRAWESMETYVAEDTSRELAGILVGHVCNGPHGPFVLIEDAVPARLADAVANGVSFTQRTWDDLYTTWSERYSHLFVVGWFHSHPGSGLFLSGYDQFTIHRFFAGWWQVSYLIDPVRRRRSLFSRRDGQLVPTPGFWVCRDDAGGGPTGPPPPPEYTRRRRAGTADNGFSPRLGLPVVAAAALLLLALLLPAMPGSVPSVRTWVADQEAQMEQLLDIHAGLADHSTALEEYAQGLERALVQVRNATASGEMDQGTGTLRTGSTRTVPPPTTTGLGRGQVLAAPPPTGGGQTATARPGESGEYVVREGDTLWHLSDRYLGDPLAYRRLAELNNIRDPHLILPGWRLTIPDELSDPGADR